MIEGTLFEAGNGRVVGYCVVRTESDLALQEREGVGVIEGHHDADTLYIADGQPTPRPALSLPLPVATVGADWTVQGVPAGAEVEVDGDPLPEPTDGTDLTLVFPMAGAWPVTIRSPFPWREATCIVEVTS